MHFDFRGPVIGNVTRDPELTFTQAGDARCTFGLAMNHQRRARDGEGYEDVGTTFIEVTCWRDLAENVAETVTKGMRVFVLGPLETQDWEDKDGNPRSTLRIEADDCGPSLRWATAEVTKAERTQRSERSSSRSNGRSGGGNRGGNRGNRPGGRSGGSRGRAATTTDYPPDEEPF